MQNSFNYMFYSTLTLGLTLFVRYTGELTWIYAQGWDAYKLKLPLIYLYLGADLCLILVLILYARLRLRSKKLWANSKAIYESEMNGLPEDERLIHNDLNFGALGTGQPSMKNVNSLQEPLKNENVDPEAAGPSLTYYHYPPITPIPSERANKPLPPLPQDELDNISLPPKIPLASPDELDL